jgi:two-component system response regulator BaeR
MKPHIMLVEDEVELAQLVRDYLEAAGFEVSMFHDGQDAYTQFQQRKPNLMILDLDGATYGWLNDLP